MLESYILLQSIWGVPPACGPLLQLATAHAGQGNSLNEAGNRLDTEKMLQPQSLTRWKYIQGLFDRVILHISISHVTIPLFLPPFFGINFFRRNLWHALSLNCLPFPTALHSTE